MRTADASPQPVSATQHHQVVVCITVAPSWRAASLIFSCHSMPLDIQILTQCLHGANRLQEPRQLLHFIASTHG